MGNADGNIFQSDATIRGGNAGSNADHQSKSDVWKLFADSRRTLGSLHSSHLIRSGYHNIVLPNASERVHIFHWTDTLRTTYKFFIQAVFDCESFIGESTKDCNCNTFSGYFLGLFKSRSPSVLSMGIGDRPGRLATPDSDIDLFALWFRHGDLAVI